MLRTSETETEILLGNKQLLGIFFVVAILLGASFTGGYMLGRDSGGKKKTGVVSTAESAVANPSKPEGNTPTAGETHSFPTDTGPSTDAAPASSELARGHGELPLGVAKAKRIERLHPAEASDVGSSNLGNFSPEAGQQFLQVAAVGRDEAEAVADVLHKKGFRAHAVPKPGTAKLYRVIIGPIRDPGDLSNTRDALRRTGFREVIVQRY